MGTWTVLSTPYKVMKKRVNDLPEILNENFFSKSLLNHFLISLC